MAWQAYARRRVVKTAVLAAAISLYACSPRVDSPAAVNNEVLAGLSESDRVTGSYIDVRPAALVQGRVVEWAEMRPLLNEAAGATVLREVTLDRALAIELLKTGIEVRPDDVDRERQLFYETLDPDPDVAVRLGRRLRARQGLGEYRFERLLRRNAGLRMLVADRVVVTSEAIERMYELVYGPTRQARLIVVPTLADAQRAVDRINAGEPFIDVAVEISTDASAARGGLLAPMSSADPTYPQIMRDALWELEAGEVSSPIFLGDQYAVLQLVREDPGEAAAMEDVRADLARRVQLTQERLLMDQLARRLLAETKVTIIDDALQESWELQQRRQQDESP